jgi:hypothetical protein
MSNKQTAESFWARVKKTQSCWEWQGAKNGTGYGSVGWHGKTYSAHRVAAYLAGMLTDMKAPNATDRANTHVLHKCDNRKCCNPDHLFLGSYRDNMLDAYKKNRKSQLQGEAHTNAKLSNKQAQEIRKRYEAGEMQIPLAKEFNVSQKVISLIIRNETYKCN